MRMRRGSSFYRSEMAGLLDQFKPGDLVWNILVGDESFYGVVREANRKENKVYVAWGGGSVSQHDPDELMPVLYQGQMAKRRMAGQLERVSKTVEEAEDDPQFVGDPEEHGLDTPLTGGFNVMQELVKKQRQESYENAGLVHVPAAARDASEKTLRCRRGLLVASAWAPRVIPRGAEIIRDPYKHPSDGSTGVVLRLKNGNVVFADPAGVIRSLPRNWERKGSKTAGTVVEEKVTTWPDGTREERTTTWEDDAPVVTASEVDGLRVRRAMYHGAPGRVYRLKKVEQNGDPVRCPKCGYEGMDLEPYTRSEKMYRCPECGFKVPTGKTVTERPQVEVEIEPDGEVEISVASARRGSRQTTVSVVAAPKNSKVWKHMLDKAKEDKEWAESHEYAANPDDWPASTMSIDMLKDRLNTPVEKMAQKAYDYFYHRSHMMTDLRGVPWPLDPAAKKKWEEITGKPIPEDDWIGSGATLREVQKGGSYLKVGKKKFKEASARISKWLKQVQSKSGKIKKRQVEDLSNSLLRAYLGSRSEELAQAFYGGGRSYLDLYALAQKNKATDLSFYPLWKQTKGVVADIVELANGRFKFKLKV